MQTDYVRSMKSELQLAEVQWVSSTPLCMPIHGCSTTSQMEPILDVGLEAFLRSKGKLILSSTFMFVVKSLCGTISCQSWSRRGLGESEG